MEPVAPGDVVAIHAPGLAILFKRQERLVGFHAVGHDVVGFVQGRGPGVLTSNHQVAGDFGLAVDHHRLAAGKGMQVDVYLTLAQGQLKAAMHQPFGVHALADPGLAQQVDHALFQDAGADSLLYVVRCLAFDDHGGDAGVVQQLAEQQARGAGADNGDLGLEDFHCCYGSQASRGQRR
ncbi:hypothetical protein D3C84_489960 [compost metagenome]